MYHCPGKTFNCDPCSPKGEWQRDEWFQTCHFDLSSFKVYGKGCMQPVGGLCGRSHGPFAVFLQSQEGGGRRVLHILIICFANRNDIISAKSLFFYPLPPSPYPRTRTHTLTVWYIVTFSNSLWTLKSKTPFLRDLDFENVYMVWPTCFCFQSL